MGAPPVGAGRSRAHPAYEWGRPARTPTARIVLNASYLGVCRASAWTLPPFPASSGWPALPPTALAQQPAPVTATRVSIGSRAEPQRVGAGVTTPGADGQPVQVVRPAGLVGRGLPGGEVPVGEADQGAVALGDQLDL